MKIKKSKIRMLIKESMQKIISESRLEKPPIDKDGDEQTWLYEAVAITLIALKKACLALPEEIMGMKKDGHQLINHLSNLSNAQLRGMTGYGQISLGYDRNFMAKEFLKLCKDNEIYIADHPKDIKKIGKAHMGIFLGHTAHGTSHKDVFVKTIFTNREYFAFTKRSFGSHNGVTFIKRTPQQIIAMVENYIIPKLLSLLEVDKSELVYQNTKTERRTVDHTTLKDLQEVSMPFTSDDDIEGKIKAVKEFHYLISNVNMKLLDKELNKHSFIVSEMLKSDLIKKIDDYLNQFRFYLGDIEDLKRIHKDIKNFKDTIK